MAGHPGHIIVICIRDEKNQAGPRARGDKAPAKSNRQDSLFAISIASLGKLARHAPAHWLLVKRAALPKNARASRGREPAHSGPRQADGPPGRGRAAAGPGPGSGSGPVCLSSANAHALSVYPDLAAVSFVSVQARASSPHGHPNKNPPSPSGSVFRTSQACAVAMPGRSSGNSQLPRGLAGLPPA